MLSLNNPSPLPNLLLSHLHFLYRENQSLPPPDCQKPNSSHVNVLKQSIFHAQCTQPAWPMLPQDIACSSLNSQWNIQTLQNTSSSTDSPASHSQTSLSGFKTLFLPFHLHHIERLVVIPEWNTQEFPKRVTGMGSQKAAGKAATSVANPKRFQNKPLPLSLSQVLMASAGKARTHNHSTSTMYFQQLDPSWK